MRCARPCGAGASKLAAPFIDAPPVVFRKPPVFMQAGDTVSIEIERIGTFTNRVVASR